MLTRDLPEETQIFTKAVADFAEREVWPTAQERWNAGEFPYDLYAASRELGIPGILAAEAWGGGGADTVTYMCALESLASADASFALTLQVHVLVTAIVEEFGNEEQKQQWMPRLASGEVLAGIAMTEPGAGSDLRSIQTHAKRDGVDWVINGSKTFITNSGTDISDSLVVLARTAENEFSTFIVPRDTQGFVRGPLMKKLGWRSMDTREIAFEDCRVPAASLLGDRGKGLRHVLTGLDLGRTAFGACSTGIAQRCLDLSVQHAKNRVQFGSPIGKFQAIQFKLADMLTKIDAARALTLDAARSRDLGLPSEVAASVAKLYGSRICVEVADEAFQIHGGSGFMLDSPVARLYADSKIMEIGEGSNEIQRMFLARSMGF